MWTWIGKLPQALTPVATWQSVNTSDCRSKAATPPMRRQNLLPPRCPAHASCLQEIGWRPCLATIMSNIRGKKEHSNDHLASFFPTMAQPQSSAAFGYRDVRKLAWAGKSGGDLLRIWGCSMTEGFLFMASYCSDAVFRCLIQQQQLDDFVPSQ